MPAMAPPESPLRPPAAPEGLGVEDAEEVPVGREMVEVTVGRTTLAHRSSAFELKQHVSVELIPPDAQYEQRPIVLLAKPQLSGSLSIPSMQVPDSAFAGNAQFVKSALIKAVAPLLGFEHSELSET